MQCAKPTVASATVTPTSEMINAGESYTVTCNDHHKISGTDLREKVLACANDGSLPESPVCLEGWFNLLFLNSMLLLNYQDYNL